MIKLLILFFYKIFFKAQHLYYLLEIKNAERESNCVINFVPQGNGGVTIAHPKNFKIDKTSHLKSNTYIECSGGVYIGKYFHTGRGLTIFSSNHIYDNDNFIPYDNKSINKKVIINDFVWFGSNVTIVPGVIIGEGAVVGAGSVVTKDVPKYAVVGGNPAKIIKFRNIDKFLKLKEQKKFF